MSEAAELSARALTLRRGTRTLFSGLSFTVAAGEVLVLRGVNGAGKTSLLRLVAGLTQPDAGALAWRGKAVAPFDKIRAAETLLQGHLPSLKDELSAAENLAARLALEGVAASATARATALDEAGLGAVAGLAARRLSQGQKRRIGLAHLALCQKKLWLLDEPTNALDSDGIALFIRLVERHVAAGGLAVIATHVPLTLSNPARFLDLGADV